MSRKGRYQWKTGDRAAVSSLINYLGEGLSVDQLGLLSAFLQSVGESLDVIASARQLCAGNDNNIADN